MTQQEITNSILTLLYENYKMSPSTSVLLNDITNSFSWDAGRTFKYFLDQGLVAGFNDASTNRYYVTLTNTGVKKLEKDHFIKQIETVETYLFDNQNFEVDVKTASQIAEPTKLRNLISELGTDSKFVVDYDKQTIKLREDYYEENKGGSGFKGL